jgi:hypothetical protein
MKIQDVFAKAVQFNTETGKWEFSMSHRTMLKFLDELDSMQAIETWLYDVNRELGQQAALTADEYATLMYLWEAWLLHRDAVRAIAQLSQHKIQIYRALMRTSRELMLGATQRRPRS